MKRILFLMLACIPAWVLSSCNNAPEVATDSLVLSDSKVTIPAEGGSKTVKFVTAADWSVTSSAAWITFTPASGKAGEVTLTITAEKNPQAQVRSGKVTITIPSDKFTQDITVEQEAGKEEENPDDKPDDKTDASISHNANPSVELDCQAHSFFIEEFVASHPWTATVEEGKEDWLSVSPTSGDAGLTERTITISVTENTSQEARTGKVIFKAEDATAEIQVTQAGAQPAVGQWTYLRDEEGKPIEYTFTSTYWGKVCKSNILCRKGDGYLEYQTYTPAVTGEDGVTRYGFFNMAEDQEHAAELTFYQFPEKSKAIVLPYQELWYDKDMGKWLNVADYGGYQIFLGNYSDWFSVPNPEQRQDSYFDAEDDSVYFDIYVYAYQDQEPIVVDSYYDIVGMTHADDISIWADYQYEGKRMVTIAGGPDVQSVCFVTVNGEIDSYADACALAAQTLADKIHETALPETLSPKTGMRELHVRIGLEAGIYTLLAVGNTGTFYYKTIEFVADGDRDISFRVWNSLNQETATTASCVLFGSGITQAWVKIFPAEEFLADREACVEATRESGEQIAFREGDVDWDRGPRVDFKDLTPGTEYNAVVWACNDIRMDWTHTIITTLDDDWTYLGEGTLTDDIAWNQIVNVGQKDPVTVACDVYESKLTPGKYKVTGYQKAVACEYLGWELESAPETSSFYKTGTSLILDATDPDAVRIPLQNYGVNVLNGQVPAVNGMIWVTSYAPDGTDCSVGKLANGEITFPVAAKLRICCVDGKILPGEEEDYTYYTANDHAAFKIVLPKN